MIIQSKSFDQHLSLLGLEMQDIDEIIEENWCRFVNIYKCHDSAFLSKCSLEVSAKKNRPDLIVHFNCSGKGIELVKIELCFDFHKQAEAQTNFISRTYRHRRRCYEDVLRQLLLPILH